MIGIKNYWPLLSYGLTLAICFGVPLLLTVLFYRKEKAPVKAVVIGTLVFIAFQPLTRIPLLAALQQTSWYFNYIQFNVWAAAVLYSLSAGIFEECGRFVAFRFLLFKDLNWAGGVAYGIGHGGIEAMMVGVTFVYKVASLYTISPFYLLMPGIERLMAMAIQIGLSLVVLYSVRFKKYIWLLYAIILHMLVDLPIPLIKNPLLIEGYVLIAALVSLVFIKNTKKLIDKKNEGDECVYHD